MRLKTFYANTMTEAMQMIRETMGEDAVIIATGDEHARGGVRVTAAVEPPAFEIGDDGVAGAQSWLQYDDEQDSDAVAEELTDVMLRHCVPDDILDHIISCATVMGYETLGSALHCTLDELYSFHPLPQKSYNKPIMMVGPPGSGKTLAVAKIAARGVMNGLKVSVISTDTIRAGGVEQLKAFTNLLQTPFKQANSPADLAAILRDALAQSDQVIIDSAGLNPFDTSDVRVLAKLLSIADIRSVMALPAGVDADEAGEMARVFATIGATEIMPTRIDIARRLGSLLAAAHQGGLCFSDFSNTPKVADGLLPLSAGTLAKLLVPRLSSVNKSGIIGERPNASHKNAVRQKTGIYS